MSNESFKSVAIDYETWKILTNWAEEECRSVSGQIKFLIRMHGPSNSLSEKDQYEIAHKTFLAQIKDPSYPNEPLPSAEQPTLPFAPDTESSWIQHKCISNWLRTSDTVRNQLLDIYIEWGGPLTNSELWALASGSLNLSLKAVTKQASGMFSYGYLKRRKSLNSSNEDRYQFEISSTGRKLVKQRNIKRKKLEAVEEKLTSRWLETARTATKPIQ